MLEPLIVPETGAVFRPITENLYLRQPTPGDAGAYSDAIVFRGLGKERIATRAHLLPRESWEIKLIDGSDVLLGVVQIGAYRGWVKAKLSDFPNDLVSLDDLERLGVPVTGGADTFTSI